MSDGWMGWDGWMDHWTTAPLEHRSESGAKNCDNQIDTNVWLIQKQKWRKIWLIQKQKLYKCLIDTKTKVMHFNIYSTLVCVLEISIVDENTKSAEGHGKNW